MRTTGHSSLTTEKHIFILKLVDISAFLPLLSLREILGKTATPCEDLADCVNHLT